eukprot:295823-Pelagomonas_calceolata.AAC.1
MLQHRSECILGANAVLRQHKPVPSARVFMCEREKGGGRGCGTLVVFVLKVGLKQQHADQIFL